MSDRPPMEGTPPIPPPPPPPVIPGWTTGPGPAGWPPPGSPYANPSRPASSPGSTSRAVFISAVAAVTVLALVAMAVGGAIAIRRGAFSSGATPTPKRGAGPVTATTELSARRGVTVYSDDFHNPSSGWQVSNSPTDGSFSYSSSGYVVTVAGAFDYWTPAPFMLGEQQVGIAVTATESTTSPPDAGFGVDCVRYEGTALLHYQFLLIGSRHWYLQRRDAATATNGPTLLTQGASLVAAGASPVSVLGMCATLPDGKTTRLALFLNGQKVADMTDVATTALVDNGWTTDMVFTSSPTRAVTVTATLFEERDISQ